MKTSSLIIGLLSLFCLTACKNSDKTESYNLGKTDLKITGNTAAQKEFQKGLLLLHSFEYRDAEEAFLEGQKADPECVMNFWGEGMVHNHPIWQEQDYQKGRIALGKLGETKPERLSKAKTELERDFLESLEILYGEGNKTARDKQYADFLAQLYKKYPKNDDVTAFYSLALMGTIPYISDMKIFNKAADLAAEVMERNPNHPGAVHYFIHANDEPEHAPLAKAAADRYAKVAPDAAHALHMPSHIYLSMGLWEKVINSNEDSFQASINRRERRNLGVDGLGLHSFQWLQYGYLQNERYEDAKKLMADMVSFSQESQTQYVRSHEIMMKTTYLIESRDWENDFSSIQTDYNGLNIALKARENFMHGYKAILDKDYDKGKEILAKMEKERVSASQTINLDAGIALCSAGGVSRESTTQENIYVAEAMELELKALLALKNNDFILAEKYFLDAIVLEEMVGPAPGPPTIVKPSHELYAEYLMENSRPEEALKFFDKALEFAPNRTLSVQGKITAIQLTKAQALLD